MAFVQMQQYQLLQARVVELEKQVAELQKAIPDLPIEKIVVGLEGLSQKLAGVLLDNGIDTKDKVAEALKKGVLSTIRGIGKSYLSEIEIALKE